MLRLGHTTVRRTLKLSFSRIGDRFQQRRAWSTFVEGERYWEGTPWKDVPVEEFNSHQWQTAKTVGNKHRLFKFLSEALPETIGASTNDLLQHIRTKDDFIADAISAIKLAPMAVRLTPHILSRVDWTNPLDDPIRKQFLPLASSFLPDNEHLSLDSLHEEADSPVPGLVHRYPGRALFLATSICPVYCRFCTRSYAVGGPTDTVAKKPQKPSLKRWEVIFQYIENNPDLQDIVVSGGDAYYLTPDEFRLIGYRLLGMDHMRRIRFASKGLSVAPGRIRKGDPWTEALIELSQHGRKQGKQVCLHTHINHAREITWVTKNAANYLFEHGVIVRNQSVLLSGVNSSYEALSELIKTLADINIQPYYVYQCDMVQGVEDLRTPLSTIIALDKQIRGTLSGFMMPSFVVDLPGGGGKRLVSTHEDYNEETGVAIYKAPGLDGLKGGNTIYTYYDPKPIDLVQLAALNKQKAEALAKGQTLGEFAREKRVDAEEKSKRESVQMPVPTVSVEVPTQVPTPAINWDASRQHVNNSASDIPPPLPLPIEEAHHGHDAQLAASGQKTLPYELRQ